MRLLWSCNNVTNFSVKTKLGDLSHCLAVMQQSRDQTGDVIDSVVVALSSPQLGWSNRWRKSALWRSRGQLHHVRFWLEISLSVALGKVVASLLDITWCVWPLDKCAHVFQATRPWQTWRHLFAETELRNLGSLCDVRRGSKQSSRDLCTAVSSNWRGNQLPCNRKWRMQLQGFSKKIYFWRIFALWNMF